MAKTRQPKTDDELRELSLGIHNGRYFTSAHLDRPEDATLVFMVLGMMEDLSEWAERNKVAFLYEELSKAGPRSFNGMPSFFSVQFLDHDEFARLKAIDLVVLDFMRTGKVAVSA